VGKNGVGGVKEEKRGRKAVADGMAEIVPIPVPFFLGKIGLFFGGRRMSEHPFKRQALASLLLFGVWFFGGNTGWSGGAHRPLTVLLVYAKGMNCLLFLGRAEHDLCSAVCSCADQSTASSKRTKDRKDVARPVYKVARLRLVKEQAVMSLLKRMILR